jgi:predicted DNA-binding transcriptional regulator AlpA
MLKERLVQTEAIPVAFTLWTIDECASWLKMSPDAVRCRLKRGQFPPHTYTHLGRSVRFIAERLKAWVLGHAA